MAGYTYVAFLPDAWAYSFSAFDYNRVPTGDIIYERDTTTGYTLAELQGASAALNCFTTDPSFVNAAGYDFRLAAGSPCIDTGIDVGLTLDFSGQFVGGLPDIGAYESATGTLTPLLIMVHGKK
jgi:hypothetical protein